MFGPSTSSAVTAGQADREVRDGAVGEVRDDEVSEVRDSETREAPNAVAGDRVREGGARP